MVCCCRKIIGSYSASFHNLDYNITEETLGVIRYRMISSYNFSLYVYSDNTLEFLPRYIHVSDTTNKHYYDDDSNFFTESPKSYWVRHFLELGYKMPVDFELEHFR